MSRGRRLPVTLQFSLGLYEKGNSTASQISPTPQTCQRPDQTQPGRRDDGAVQAGVAWPNPRFTVTYCNASGPC